MPYKHPEHKRRWEREHREQRNVRRRMQRSDEGSRQHTSPKSTFDLRTALRSARRPAPDPVSSRKPKATLKTILGWRGRHRGRAACGVCGRESLRFRYPWVGHLGPRPKYMSAIGGMLQQRRSHNDAGDQDNMRNAVHASPCSRLEYDEPTTANLHFNSHPMSARIS